MKKRKLIIISNDALVYDDIKYLQTKPSFNKYFNKSSWVKTLKTVYPSITYCCHTSMITGAYPEKTHLYNNEVDEFMNPKWTWERKYNQAKTLIDAAKEKGYTIANVFWPVTGLDDNIDYNIPEYWSQTPDEPLTVALKNMGASDEVIRDIVEPNLYYIDGHQRQHPYCDEFMFSCARDMILKYKPDMLIVHPASVDGIRHGYGVFNEYVNEQLDLTYYWIEKIIRAVEEIGELDNTDFVITSDHGQIDINRWCNPNVLLRENGLITVDQNGKVVDCRAYVKAVGASAQVFLVDKSKKTYDKVYKIFKDATDSKLYGFSEFFTKEQAKQLHHLAGDFEFVLETDNFTSFGGGITGDYFVNANPADYRLGHGTHGHLPDKGPQPTMFMFGPDFNEGVTVERRDTIDMAVTLAHIFGWDLPDADGKVIEEVIRKN